MILVKELLSKSFVVRVEYRPVDHEVPTATVDGGDAS